MAPLCYSPPAVPPMLSLPCCPPHAVPHQTHHSDAERRLQEANAASSQWHAVQAEAKAARDREREAWQRAVAYGNQAAHRADVRN